MDFLKKNYEKILLGLVLAGLIGVLFFMLLYIASDQQAMEDHAAGLINPPSVKALANLDLQQESNAVARLQLPYNLNFEKTNKLFNTMTWKKAPDGTLYKISTGREIGPDAVVVTNIQPLYLHLTLNSISTNEFGVRYIVGVQRQAASIPSRRNKQTRYVSVGDKNDAFTLVSVKGAPENPEGLVVKLTDTGKTVTIPRGKTGYQRVDAYAADFRYDPEKKVFHDERVGNKVYFNGADYDVVEVSSNELILSDESNQKKTSLPFTP